MNKQKQHDPFIGYLEKNREDRAMLAALRRGLGKDPGAVPDMFPYIVPFVNNSYQENLLYQVAALFALHPIPTSEGNMGNHLRIYATTLGDDEATTRRFTQLLRMNRDNIDAPLRQHISILKSKDIAVHWHQLIYDLRYWDHEDHFVQKQWASAYWSYQPSS